MTPNGKRRLVYSLIGGVLIPVSYLVALILFAYVFNWREVPATGWLTLPVLWPLYLLYLAGFLSMCGPSGPPLLIFVLVANVALYSALTYAVILWRQRPPRLR